MQRLRDCEGYLPEMAERHMKGFELILDECLDRIASGESIADVLASYPEQASSLEPLLRAAEVTLDAGRFEPSNAGMERARQKLAAARIARAAHTQSMVKPSIVDRLRRLRLPASTIATIAVLALTAVLLLRPAMETGEIPFQPPAEEPAVVDDTPGIDTPAEPHETDVPDVAEVTDETAGNPAEEVPETAPLLVPPDSDGSFVFYVSDQPNDIGDFEQLMVTVSRIELKPRDGGQWVEIVPEPMSIDLVQLQGTRATELWRGNLPEGEYDAVFLSIGTIQGTLASSGEEADVVLPSDRLHIQSPFTIAEGEDVDYVFDITVHRNGNGYLISPQATESGVGREIERIQLSEDPLGHPGPQPGKSGDAPGQQDSDPPLADKPGPGPGQTPRTRTIKRA
ncbi:MAG: DUF4382 domain-containing protein [Dehalococcoidia bacterium]|nr:DUF4382 domain-containing protein [Dehalococcoidia bacterium]